MPYLPRTVERYIRAASRQFPVLLVTGARQAGKTTLLRRLQEKGRTYVTLDDPLVLGLARDDPALFFQRFRPPLLIDEIQYAPGLLPHIKMMADRNRRAGLFWLTGSQPFHLMQGVSESLAGRVGVVRLMGLSRAEASGAGLGARPFLPTAKETARRWKKAEPPALADIYRRIWLGSFPGMIAGKNMDRDLFFGSYVQTYLQRDVRDLARVGDEMAFLRFLRAAAARTGQLLNLSELARDAGASTNTAKSWLSVLEASGLAYLLEPYYANVTKRLVKTPKLYFTDTGLAAYLTEWSSPATLEAGAMSGAILETWVVMELLKGYAHNGRRAPFYFYRDKDKKEIDLLIVQDGILYPLEIKKSVSPRKEDVGHFPALERLKMPIGQGGLVCLVGQPLPLSDNIQAIPVTLI